jgi:hypothetical protein
MITSQTAWSLECKSLLGLHIQNSAKHIILTFTACSFLLKNCYFIKSPMTCSYTWNPMINNNRECSPSNEVYLNLTVMPLEPGMCHRYFPASVFLNLQFAGYECHVEISNMWSLQIYNERNHFEFWVCICYNSTCSQIRNVSPFQSELPKIGNEIKIQKYSMANNKLYCLIQRHYMLNYSNKIIILTLAVLLWPHCLQLGNKIWVRGQWKIKTSLGNPQGQESNSGPIFHLTAALVILYFGELGRDRRNG